jgi:peptidoglycan/LPS O-acetylase OafA/YrhL
MEDKREVAASLEWLQSIRQRQGLMKRNTGGEARRWVRYGEPLLFSRRSNPKTTDPLLIRRFPQPAQPKCSRDRAPKLCYCISHWMSVLTVAGDKRTCTPLRSLRAMSQSAISPTDGQTGGGLLEAGEVAKKPPSPTGGRATSAIDLDSHNGLRGVAAVWVVVFHCLSYCPLGINLLGSTLMPLFFVLSGFSLAVVYGAEPLPPPSCCGLAERGGASVGPEGTLLKPFDYWGFQQNRVARVMPGACMQRSAQLTVGLNRLSRAGYYAGLVLTLPQWFFGYGYFPQTQGLLLGLSIAASVLPIISLLSPVVGLFVYPVDGPTWTITSLLVMWLFFPRWLAHGQRLTDAQLVSGIVIMFWVQHVPTYAIFFPISILGGGALWWSAFSTATMNPLSRLPVLLMGVYAGILARWHPDDAMPWPSSWLGLPFVSACCPAASVGDATWRAWADRRSIILLACTLVLIAAQLAIHFLVGPVDLGCNVWWQAWVAFEQLTVAVALTRDRSASLASRFLRRPLLQWLGQLSMAVYVVHWPVMYYLAWAVNGGTNEPPAQTDCSVYTRGSDASKACLEGLIQWRVAQLPPSWNVVVVLPVAIALGWLVFWYVEEPGRRLLRARGRKP